VEGDKVQSTGEGKGPPGSYNFLDLRNLNLHNTTLCTHYIPPPHLQVHERGNYMTYTKAVAASYSFEPPPDLHTTSSSMSQPAISDTANPSNPPKAEPAKSLSVPPSVTLLLIPSHTTAQGLNRDTDGAPGDEIADSKANNGDGLPEQSESVVQTGGDIFETNETPITQISERGERRQ
jgi:hypothetical protein